MNIDRTIGEDTNTTHLYRVVADGQLYEVEAVDAFDAEGRVGKLYFQVHGHNPHLIKTKMISRAKAQGAVSAARDVAESVDEGAGELVKAIEHAVSEIEDMRYRDAKITLRMALAAHKARITTPTPLAQLWENDKEMGE